jgi:proteasome lid subunit RPN8/RPN11
MTLRIPGAVMDAIHAGLVRAYPEEGCRVLLGVEKDGARDVVGAETLGNDREDSRGNRYVISPGRFLAAERAARERGLDVVGFFHSHPDHPARPSAFDLEHAWPWYSYLIVSVVRGRPEDATSWRMSEDRSRFEPEGVAIVAAVPGGPPGGMP